jgi:hypothetical protein
MLKTALLRLRRQFNMGAVLGTLFGTSPIQTQQNQSIAGAAQPGTDQYNQALAASQGGINQQQALASALANQGGIGNQSAVFSQQEALADQLGKMATGQGPNPALAQLNQTTGQNVADQAALMAGQRGAGANAGLMARQAGQQGAATQQQAVGQAATLNSQQQLAATTALQQQQAMMGNTAGAQVGQQMGATGTLNNLLTTQQGQASGQQQILGNMASTQNSQDAALSQAQTQQNNAMTQMWGNIASGAVTQGANLLKKAPMAEGGQVGEPSANLKENYKGKSKLGSLLYAHGGKVPVLVSPGEKILTPEQAKKAKDGKVNPMAVGKEVPGTPKVGGAVNDYANDNVFMHLRSESVVLPRSVTQSEDSDDKAKKFVSALKSKKGSKK